MSGMVEESSPFCHSAISAARPGSRNRMQTMAISRISESAIRSLFVPISGSAS